MDPSRHKQISPSVLSADFTKLAAEIESLDGAGCQVLHLDVMDGQYVPNLTFGPMVVEAIRRLTSMELEAHLMITQPDKYLEAFIGAGADVVLIHPQTCASVSRSLARIHALGAKAGLVVNPDEELALVRPFLDEMDQLLIMSVYPGFGGQKFMPEVLRNLAEFLPLIEARGIILEIDGGINTTTLPGLLETGIQRFVAGSAVFNTLGSPAQNFLKLTNQLS